MNELVTRHCMKMNRGWCRACAMLALLVAGCAGLGGPRVITLTEGDLARLIERKFPFDRRVAEVFEVRVPAPRVRMLPEANRLATEFDVEASDRLFGRTLRGRIALDYALRYDERDPAIRLTQVHVRRLTFDGTSAQSQALLERIGALIAEQALDDLAIYRFKPEDLRAAAGIGLAPGAVTVTPRGVEITLNPVQ
jgi:hypothetical protein